MKTQRGQIFRSGKNWYGRWRRDELVAVSDLSKTERCELEARGVLKADHDGSKVVVAGSIVKSSPRSATRIAARAIASPFSMQSFFRQTKAAKAPNPL